MDQDPSEIIAQLVALSAEETSAFVDEIVELLGGEHQEEAVDLLVLLSVFTSAVLTPALTKLVELEEFFPPHVFRSANTMVSDLLVAAITEGTSDQHRALQALAWIGDEAAVAALARWRGELPESLAELRRRGYSIDSITHEAGWEFDAEGQVRRLSSVHCTALVELDNEEPGPGVVQLPSSDSCPWCNEPLVALFRLSLSDLGLPQAPTLPDILDVTTCMRCVADEASVFMRVEADGSSHWHPSSSTVGGPTAAAEYLAGLGKRTHLTPRLGLGDVRPPWHAVQESLPSLLSQVGGLPTWVQHAHYPDCPECEATMTFLAQVDQHKLNPNYEGVFYGFLCAPCSITSSRFQMG